MSRASEYGYKGRPWSSFTLEELEQISRREGRLSMLWLAVAVFFAILSVAILVFA